MCRSLEVVRLAAVLPTLRFSRKFRLVFFVEVFLKTCGLLVLIEICLFFGLVFCRFLFCGLLFFQILWHFYCLNLLLKAYWACFCEDLLILGLFFQICHPDSLFDFLANFAFC